MNWKASGPHAIASDEGYKVARYRIDRVEYFRPSFKGSFIGAPLQDKEAAKRVCLNHHKGQ